MPLRSEGSTFGVRLLRLLGEGPFPTKVSRVGMQQLCSCGKTNVTLTELTGRAAPLILDVFANDDKIFWRGHLFTHLFALHDDDESLGEQLRVVQGSQTQTGSAAWRSSVQFIVPYDTKLEGEAEHENLFLRPRKGLQERRVSIMFRCLQVKHHFLMFKS